MLSAWMTAWLRDAVVCRSLRPWLWRAGLGRLRGHRYRRWRIGAGRWRHSRGWPRLGRGVIGRRPGGRAQWVLTGCPGVASPWLVGGRDVVAAGVVVVGHVARLRDTVIGLRRCSAWRAQGAAKRVDGTDSSPLRRGRSVAGRRSPRSLLGGQSPPHSSVQLSARMPVQRCRRDRHSALPLR